MSEWNLSSKITKCHPASDGTNEAIHIEDFKEFIKKLFNWIELTDHFKETGKYQHMIHKGHLKRRIRKLAGKKLT